MIYLVIAILAIVLILVIYIIVTYNSLKKLKNKVLEKGASIDVTLKKRADLVPNLLEAVKGFTSHEKDTLEAITKARSDILASDNINNEKESANSLTKNIGRLLIVAEKYPEIKASENFRSFFKDLIKNEDDIMLQRQFYNDSVVELNTKIESFPAMVVAKIFNYKKEEFLEFEEIDRLVLNV